jgi:hypothetical protein
LVLYIIDHAGVILANSVGRYGNALLAARRAE